MRPWAFALLALGAHGCNPQTTVQVRVAPGTPLGLAEIAPGTLPGKEATLRLAGTDFPVELQRNEVDGRITLNLLAHGETFEHETYRQSATEFALLDAAGNLYDPPMPLLRFPLTVGSSWGWRGKESAGGIAREASATVTTSSEKLYVDAVPVETIVVTADLELPQTGNAPKAKRRLSFWFAPGEGVVKREFGAASVREPLTP